MLLVPCVTLFFILTFLVLVFLTGQIQKIIFEKLPKVYNFFSKYKRKIIPVVLSIACVTFAFVTAEKALKISDTVIPTVGITSPKNNVIASKQYDTPLIYHFCFDDETELKEVNFTTDSIDLGNITAEININKVSDTEYVLSLSNIVGESGAHSITLNEGVAKDRAGNVNKSVSTKSFYLYNEESDIDKEAPTINFKQINSNDDKTALFNISITDDNELSSTRLNEKDLILIGFSADIDIERDLNNYSVKLTNIKKTDKNCLVVITNGIAKDSWNNSSEYTVNSIDI